MGGMPVTAGRTLGAAVTCSRFPPCLWVLGVRGGVVPSRSGPGSHLRAGDTRHGRWCKA